MPTAVRRRKDRSSRGGEGRPSDPGFSYALEPLESRLMLSVNVTINYSFDTQNFFDTQLKRDLLQHAADQIVRQFDDELSAIVPGGSNTWSARFSHPGTGAAHQVNNLRVNADELIVFAGGRQLGATLGMGGHGGFSVSGSPGWVQTVRTRGQSGAAANPATDFGPWGGAIVFDIDTDWYFGISPDGLGRSQNDFLTVATHELIHLLGFNSGVDSFRRFVSGGLFTGPLATAEFDGAGSPPMSGDSHWADITDEGAPVIMFTTLTQGTRRTVTPLDMAALGDVGWQINGGLPRIDIADASVLEGDSGQTNMVFTVSLSFAAASNVTVQFATANSTAAAGEDYLAAAGVLTIPAGQTSATISVPVIGDTAIESDERFFVNLSGASSNASIRDGQAVGKIINDDDGVDLAVKFVSADIPGPIWVPGDSGKARIKIRNLGNKPGNGSASVELLLVSASGQETVIGSITNLSLKVPAGGSQAVKLKFTVPASLAPADYSLRARLTDIALSGGRIDLVAANNLDEAPALRTIARQFGTVGDRKKVVLSVRDGDGTDGTFSIRGPGTGQLVFDDSGAVDLRIEATTDKSRLKLGASGGDGAFVVDDIIVGLETPASLGFVLARAVTLTGDVTITGPLGLKALKISQWLDNDRRGDDELTAPWVRKLKVGADLEADLNLSGAGAPGGVALGKAKIGGVVRGAQIRTGGHIRSLTAAGLHNSLIFAGVASGLNAAPDSLDDFTADLLIGKLTFKGEPPSGAAHVIGSSIAAQRIGTLKLNRTDSVTIAADRVTGSISFTHGSPPVARRFGPLRNPADAPAPQDGIQIRIL